MRRKLCLFALVISMLCMALSVSATSAGNISIVSESMGATIEANILEDDIQSYDFLFGTSDVQILYDNAMPYYMYTYGTSYESLSDLYEFSGNYIVPVVSNSGEFLGYAEYSETDTGEWEIISVSQGTYFEKLYEVLSTCPICKGYKSAFLGGDPFFTEVGIILSNGDSEEYFDCDSYIAATMGGTVSSTLSYTDYYSSAIVKANDLINIATNLIVNSDDNPVEGGTTSDDETINDLDVEYQDIGKITIGYSEEIPDEEPVASESTGSGMEDHPHPIEGGISSDESNPTTGIVLPVMLSAISLSTALSSRKRR